jgi:glycosyltransferase involved in cell wall biosynthesis
MVAEAKPARAAGEATARAEVWMIIPTYYPVVGGAQSQVTRLSQWLAAQGWTVRVLTRRHSWAHPQGLAATGVVAGVPVQRVYSRGARSGGLLFVLAGLWQLLRAGRGHIYHAHDVGAAGWLAVVAARLCGGYSLIKLRTGVYAYDRYLASRTARWQFSALLRLADHVVVVNSEVQEMLVRMGLSPDRVVRLPNAVSLERFRPPTAEERRVARQALGLTDQETMALYVGRLEELKGADVLLAAWAQLPAQQRQRARLVLVGQGPEEAVLKQQAAEAGLADSVLFAGEQKNVLDYYWAADLFVLPSRSEGLSNALLEAMGCEIAVVASAVGGALDLVEEGESGLLFVSEDAAGLAAQLERLLDDQTLQRRLGVNGRQCVAGYAELPLIARRLQTIYQGQGER